MKVKTKGTLEGLRNKQDIKRLESLMRTGEAQEDLWEYHRDIFCLCYPAGGKNQC